MKKKKIITEPKSTTIKQYTDKDGLSVIELHCDICGHCPCLHVKMGFDGYKIKSPEVKQEK